MPKSFHLSGPEHYAEIKLLACKERTEWKRQRLRVVQMGISGQYTREQIAEVTGSSVRSVGRHAAAFRKGGVSKLLSRDYGGGPPPAIQPAVAGALLEKLRAGEFKRAKEVVAWLGKEHSVELSLKGAYYWLGKCGGVLKVPRKTHAKKDAAAAEAFPRELPQRLAALPLRAGAPMRVWVVDEHRHGLIGTVRRCWALRGQRPLARWQARYEWGYVYGALELGEGGAEFCFLPTVSLECSALFLAQIAASDPQAEHIVIWDGAGFHQRTGAPEVPERVHLVLLPPYSPELNPVEQLWDLAKDACGNRVFATLDEQQEVITEELRPFWESSSRVKQLLGNHPVHASVNSSSNSIQAIA